MLISIFVLSACNVEKESEEISSFEECVEAGNPVMESYPRQCRSGEETFVEELEVSGPEEKPCTREYVPVCGEVDVRCVKAPCNPVKQTFSNRCMAENAGAKNIIEGKCQTENISQECISEGGRWISEADECEGISEEKCSEIGGNFNECASACRNDPDAQMCTMQCVLVCEF